MKYMKLIAASLLLLILLPNLSLGQSIVSIPKVKIPPSIDGILTPGEWDNAAVTAGFKLLNSGFLSPSPVIISTCYNNDTLFIAWECKGEPSDKLAGKLEKRDSPIWRDPSVELFLANPNWKASKYLHFIVNHAGAVYDEMCINGTLDPTWNADWQVKTSKADNGYTVEMAIPWSVIDITPRDGIRLRANFARTSSVGSGASITWAKMSGGFHTPASFGSIVLGGNGSYTRISYMPDRTKGKAVIYGQSSKNTMLTVQMLSGDRPLGNKAEMIFKSSGKSGLTLDVPYGADYLQAQVLDQNRNVIWSQDVNMDIPDIPGKLAEMRQLTNTLTKTRDQLIRKYGKSNRTAEDLSQIINCNNSDYKGFDERSKPSLTIKEMELLQNDVTTAIGHLEIIRAAIDFTSSRKTLSESLPRFFVTNPISTDKILPSSGKIGPFAENLNLAMMKNEFEPIQIVVCSTTSDLRNIVVSSSELTSSDGHKIPVDRISITPIAYVKCKTATPGAKYTGQIPDVLMPNKPINLSKNGRQPFFITVHTKAEDAAGTYTGTVTISEDGANKIELPLQVKVYDVTLPVKSSLRTVFLLGWAFQDFMDGAMYQQALFNYSKTMLEHRLSASIGVPPVKKADGTWDFTEMDNYLNELVPLGQTTFRLSEDIETLKAQAEHLKQRGMWDIQYLYGHDEAAPNMAEELQRRYKDYIDAVPDVKVMQTGWNPDPKLKNLVRVWCPLTSNANMNVIKEAQAAGDEAWWYVCCGPTAPCANLFVDYPGIDHRILGWQTFQNDITGFLYWGLDVWKYAGNTLPLSDYLNADYANWNPQSYADFNGDGYLCYPGKNGTAVPSMRLALLRDGFEDCDLFSEAKALASKAGKAGDRLSKLLDLSDISKSLTEYTQDGNKLLERREKIMQEMETIQKSLNKDK